MRARWSAYGLAKAVEVAVAFAPFVAQLSWPVAAVIVCLADNLDGILVHGFGGRRYWGRYRGAERWADFATFMPLAAYPLWAGILKEIWPVLVLLIILVPLITVGKIALGGWKRVFRPGTFEVLLPVAVATLLGIEPQPAGGVRACRFPADSGMGSFIHVEAREGASRLGGPSRLVALARGRAIPHGCVAPGDSSRVPLLTFFAAFERG